MPDVFEYSHRVKDDEIDALGRASNVAYIEWMLAAALGHSTAQGWPVDAYLKRGAGWVVRSHAIEYRGPALAGDEIVVRTWVATMDGVTSIRRYRICRRAGGELLAEAETRWAFIDFATGRPMRIPKDVAQAFPVLGLDHTPLANAPSAGA